MFWKILNERLCFLRRRKREKTEFRGCFLEKIFDIVWKKRIFDEMKSAFIFQDILASQKNFSISNSSLFYSAKIKKKE